MHLGPLCMQVRAPVIFFLLFGANSSPEKVQHVLVSPKFDKNSAKWNVFWCRNGIWGAFVVGPLQPKSALFRGTHPTPLKTEIPTLSTKSQTFYAINFFSDSPEGFALLMHQFAALRSLAQLTTYNLASGNAPKWGFFPKDRTYRAFFVP